MSYQIRRFDPADRAAMLAFALRLPRHDLMFLDRDLRHPRVIEAWLSEIAEQAGAIVGITALVRDPLG